MSICWWNNKMQTGCWYSLTGKTKVLLSSIKMNFEGNRAYLDYRSPSTIEITLSMKFLLTDQIHNHASKTLERLPRCSLWPCSQEGAPAWVPVISALYWLLIPWSQSCGPVIVTWQPWYINLQSPSSWADPKVYILSVRDSHSVGCIIDRSFRRQSFLPLSRDHLNPGVLLPLPPLHPLNYLSSQLPLLRVWLCRCGQWATYFSITSILIKII